MSKMMSELRNLNEVRKKEGGIVLEDEQKVGQQAPVIHQFKGGTFFNILLVILIGISVFSMSISLKTFTQLEESWADSKSILAKLNQQQSNIEILQSLIADNNSEELTQMADLSGQIKELQNSVDMREQELANMKIAQADFNSAIGESIRELEISDDLILKKYMLLNDRVSDALKFHSALLNTY